MHVTLPPCDLTCSACTPAGATNSAVNTAKGTITKPKPAQMQPIKEVLVLNRPMAFSERKALA